MTDTDAILAGVLECLGSVLDIPTDSIGAQDRLVGDLGADSLDLLDLTFQLEQRFAIRISPRDIERRVEANLDGAPLLVGGVYTSEAVAQLRAFMPEVPPEELADGLLQVDLPLRFRVATMVNLVSQLLGEGEKGE